MDGDSRGRIGRQGRWKLDNFTLKNWLEGQNRRTILLRKLKESLEALGSSQAGVHRGLLQLFSSPKVRIRRISDLERCGSGFTRNVEGSSERSKIVKSKEIRNSSTNEIPELSAENVGSDTSNGRFVKARRARMKSNSLQSRNGKNIEVRSRALDTELRKADSSVSENVVTPIPVIISTGTEVTCSSSTDTISKKIATLDSTNNIKLKSINNSDIGKNEKKRKSVDTMAISRDNKKLRKESKLKDTSSQDVSTVGKKYRPFEDIQKCQRRDKGKDLDKSRIRSTKLRDRDVVFDRSCNVKPQEADRKRKKNSRARKGRRTREKLKEIFGDDYSTDDDIDEGNLSVRKWQEELTRLNKVLVRRDDSVKKNSLSATEVDGDCKRQKDFIVTNTSMADRISLKIAKTKIYESCRRDEEVHPCANDTSVGIESGFEISRNEDIDLVSRWRSSKKKSLSLVSSRETKRSRTPDVGAKESRRKDKRKVEYERTRYGKHDARRKSRSSKIHKESSKSLKARADSTNRMSKIYPVTETTDVKETSRISFVEDTISDKTPSGETKSIESLTDSNEVDVASSEKSIDHPNEETNGSQEAPSPILPDSSTSPLYPSVTRDPGSPRSNFKYTESPKLPIFDLSSKSRDNASKSISRTNDNPVLSSDSDLMTEIDKDNVSTVVIASPKSSASVSTNEKETSKYAESNETAPDSSVTIECNVENMSESHSDPKGLEEDFGKESGFLQDIGNRSVPSNPEEEVLRDVPFDYTKCEPADKGDTILTVNAEKIVARDTVHLTASVVSPNNDEILDKSSETDSNTNKVLSASVNSITSTSMVSSINSNVPITQSPEDHVPKIRVKDARELGGVRWCPTPFQVPNVVTKNLINSPGIQPRALRTLLPNNQKSTDNTPTAPTIQFTFHPAAKNVNPMSGRYNSISNQVPAVQQQISPTYVLLQVENVQQFVPYQNPSVKQPPVQRNIDQTSQPQSIPGSVVRRSNDDTDFVSQQNSYVHGLGQSFPQQQLQPQLELQQRQQQQLQLQHVQQPLQQQQLLQMQQVRQQLQLQQKQQPLQRQQHLEQRPQLQQQQTLQEAVKLIFDKIFLSLVRIRQLLERKKITIQFSTRLRQEECQQVQREFNVNFQILVLELGNLRKILKVESIDRVIAYAVNVMNERLAQGMLPFTVKEIEEIVSRKFETTNYPVDSSNKASSKEDQSVVIQPQTMDYEFYSKYVLGNQIIPLGQTSIFTEIQKIIFNNQVLQYRFLTLRLQKQLQQLKEAEEAVKFKEIQRELGTVQQDAEDSEELEATEMKDIKDENQNVLMQERLTLQQDRSMLDQLPQVQKKKVEPEESPTDTVGTGTREESPSLKKELNSEVLNIMQQQYTDEIKLLIMAKDIDSYNANVVSPDVEIVFDKKHQNSVIVNGKNAQSNFNTSEIVNAGTNVLRETERSREDKLNVKLTHEVSSMEGKRLRDKKNNKTVLPSIMDVRSISPVVYESMKGSIATPSPLDFASLEEMRASKGTDEDEDEDADTNAGSDDDMEKKVCLLCAKPSRVACGRCYDAQYCSVKCAQVHWQKCHHETCKPAESDGA